MACLRRSFCVLAFALPLVSCALGPISVAEPKLAGGTVENNAPPGPFFQDFKPPFPTNAWWSGFAALPQNARVAGPVPYASICTNDSFQFGLSQKRSFDGTSVHQPAQLDYGLSFVEHESGLDTHKASAWDTQSLSIDFFSSTSKSFMRLFLVPGSPYMTVQFNASTPLVTSLAGAISSINGIGITVGQSVNVTAAKFTITSSIGSYIVYSLNGPLKLSVDAFATTVKASAPFSGVLRFAKLDRPAHQPALDSYVANYPTSVSTDYTFNGTEADLTFTWNVVGDPNKLLMLTYPHHRRALVSPHYLPLASLAHMTLKGWMYPALGASWTMRYTLSSIDFNAPRMPDDSCLGALIKGLEYEVAHMGDPEQPGDFYNWGNHIAALSRLGLIADVVSRPDLVQEVLDHLKGTFSYWGDPSYTNVQAAYETNWGGVVNKAGAGSVFVDFGNGQYNDHNLQYGYFLAAGAMIAKFDPDWLNEFNGASTNAEMLSFIARDIANPSSADPFFPVVRHRDWFAGHSWASGVANGAGSRDQESSTEGVNAYYGTLLYSIVTGQTELEQFARLLVRTEQLGSQTYWHLYPDASPTDRDEPYPEASARALVTMGNVEDEQAGAWLFWGAERVEIAAIQILPVTPINEDLYDAVWVQNLLNYTANELADPTAGDAWKSVIYLAYSNFNPQKAATLSTSLASWGSGNSYSNQVYFISTRPNPTGAPICGSAQLNPEGTFLIQDIESGLFVTSTSSQPALMASAADASDGSLFQLSFMPGGGSFQNFATGLFVTANPSGTNPVAALSQVPSTWEVITAVPAPGGDDGVFNLRSGANLLWMDSTSGTLLNSASTQSAASQFRIITPPPPQGTFLLQDAQSGQFVQASGDNPTLSAAVSSASGASVFNISSDSGGTTIQLLETGQFVSATPSTDDPLQASRGEASIWETFVIAPKVLSTDVSIAAVSNGHFVIVTGPNGDLVNSVPSPSSATSFRLVRPGNPLGVFFIQDVASEKFLSSSQTSPDLTASGSSQSLGSLFLLSSDGSIQNLETGGFVAASHTNFVLSKVGSGSHQSFAVVAKPLAPDQFTVRKSDDNSSFFVTQSNGTVVVQASDADSASTYRFVAPTLALGTFLLQDAQTGKFVSSSFGAPDLVARETSGATATWFNISSQPGLTGASIQSTLTSQFTTSDPAGVGALSALRPVASLWEMFTIWPKSGTPDEFVIQAGANNQWVVTSASGALVNSAATYKDGTGYRIVGAQNPVGKFALQDSVSGLWVTSSAERQQLVADGTSQGGATPFDFEILADTPGGSMQNTNTAQFVSVDPDGTTPASASRASPSAWETWVVRIHIGSPDLFTLQSINNNCWLVSTDDGVFNNASSIDNATLFRFASVS